MAHLVFGNENAENDALLDQCQVTRGKVKESKPILIGRWGTGKSALLMLQNRDLAGTLEALDPDLKDIWLIKERGLDIKAIMDLKTSMGDKSLFLRALEGVWKAEIVRSFSQQLIAMRSLYANSSGEHWNYVAKLSSKFGLIRNIWEELPRFLGILTRSETSVRLAKETTVSIEDTFTLKAIQNVKKCLRDIREGEQLPCVAIEPIETPTSASENETGLAQALITSLLNVFKSHFEPTDDNNVVVRMSIPWHRCSPEELDFPQKFPQYIGQLSWTRDLLTDFIEKRIQWEFDRVGRIKPADKSHWEVLFGETILNRVCEPHILEKSKAYFVRHTHWRARDLQRLCRTCVEEQADAVKLGIDDVLRGKQIGRVSEKVIKNTFRGVCSRAAEELVVESSRRYPQVKDIVPHMRGLPNPFTTDQLKKRIARSDVDYDGGLEMLWNSGIVGVTAEPHSAGIHKHLQTIYTDDASVTYRKDDKTLLYRWSWYEYNSHIDAGALINSLRETEDCDVGLALHPKVREYLTPKNTASNSPIGI